MLLKLPSPGEVHLDGKLLMDKKIHPKSFHFERRSSENLGWKLISNFQIKSFNFEQLGSSKIEVKPISIPSN